MDKSRSIAPRSGNDRFLLVAAIAIVTLITLDFCF
jgi:hypothetical protein